MTEYNIIIELPDRKLDPDTADTLLDQFALFHPAIGFSVLGWVEVTLTVQAESLAQAVATGLALTDAGGGRTVVSAHGMTTVEYDRRPVAAERLPELLSAPEAAQRLGISPQAVGQQLEAGRLIGVKVGATWVLPASQFEGE